MATDEFGIAAGYFNGQNRWQPASRRTKGKLRQAMGGRAAGGAGDLLVLAADEGWRPPGPCELTLEDGTVADVDSSISLKLPVGYHSVKRLDGAVTRMIVHPGQCFPPGGRREWGWAVQLYALRSRRSWGMGDFADLRRFARFARNVLGTNFLLLNPLGAPLPVTPVNASPYYPASRLFLDPLYICVEEIANGAGAVPETVSAAGRTLNAERLIDRDKVFRLKMSALEKIHGGFAGHREFDRFCAERGEMLGQFAVFCTLAERYQSGWREWPEEFRRPGTEAVEKLAAKHSGRVQFHQWVQWQLDLQFRRAARELPLMLDVPVGVDPNGFDAWRWQDLLALNVSIGAPPDAFNADGQSWGLPPFIPHRLRAAGYAPFRETLRAMLRHARGLRIDHVMGLFRLFWIPEGDKPGGGGYVRYPAEELLAVLAIESQRGGALVVGEDLGTVEHSVRSRLRRRNVLSYRLHWFENKPPEKYPPAALAALTTHDLFTVAGLWTGKDEAAQTAAGLHPNVAGAQEIRQRLARSTGLRATAPTTEAVLGAHRLLARTPCRLITATLDDALCVEERPNMPGTTTQWPNWRLALPKSLEEIQKDEFVRKLAKVMGGR